MLKGIDCPCCIGCTKSVINCQCGLERDKFHGDAVLHISNYCNKNYTQCKQYQIVRRWMNRVSKNVSICQIIS
jgi:hypothetical protein